VLRTLIALAAMFSMDHVLWSGLRVITGLVRRVFLLKTLQKSQ